MKITTTTPKELCFLLVQRPCLRCDLNLAKWPRPGAFALHYGKLRQMDASVQKLRASCPCPGSVVISSPSPGRLALASLPVPTSAPTFLPLDSTFPGSLSQMACCPCSALTPNALPPNCPSFWLMGVTQHRASSGGTAHSLQPIPGCTCYQLPCNRPPQDLAA